MFDKNIEGHDFVPFVYDGDENWVKCKICRIEIFMNMDDDREFDFYNTIQYFPNEDESCKVGLSCTDVIIKQIIE